MKARGFMLIELLIVIAIIGIVAMIIASHVMSYSPAPANAVVVPDRVDTTKCQRYQDSNGVILSCPDGNIYYQK